MVTGNNESHDKSLTDQELEAITFRLLREANIFFGPPSFPLFHYTSLETFKEMLTSRTLWASHFRYLNDVTEFSYAVQLIAGRIEARQKESRYLQYAAVEARKLIPTDLLKGPYVISFSENGDFIEPVAWILLSDGWCECRVQRWDTVSSA
jgi:hypothetical protein